jgi:hypothetical protein
MRRIDVRNFIQNSGIKIAIPELKIGEKEGRRMEDIKGVEKVSLNRRKRGRARAKGEEKERPWQQPTEEAERRKGRRRCMIRAHTAGGGIMLPNNVNSRGPTGTCRRLR